MIDQETAELMQTSTEHFKSIIETVDALAHKMLAAKIEEIEVPNVRFVTEDGYNELRGDTRCSFPMTLSTPTFEKNRIEIDDFKQYLDFLMKEMVHDLADLLKAQSRRGAGKTFIIQEPNAHINVIAYNVEMKLSCLVVFLKED